MKGKKMLKNWCYKITCVKKTNKKTQQTNSESAYFKKQLVMADFQNLLNTSKISMDSLLNRWHLKDSVKSNN